MTKRKLSVNRADLSSAVEVDVQKPGYKQSKLGATSSPKPISTSDSSQTTDIMEGVEFSSTAQTTDDTSVPDLTRSSTPELSSGISSDASAIIDTDMESSTQDTMVVDKRDTTSPPNLQYPGIILCTIKFSESYYLDFKTPWTDANLFFDLTQDPTLWVHFFKRSPHTQDENNPNDYIRHCLYRIVEKSGSCRDLLGVLMFAWIFDDNYGTCRFWESLENRAMEMMDFKDAFGQPVIGYLGRIVMPRGLLKGCWNKKMQEFLEYEGLLGPVAYFAIGKRNGFRWVKPEDGEIAMENRSIVDNWVIELPRNEYYY
ncbi:hypothetical protein NHQ30_007010 [Ciborinia camelliae]|nr:hypothetical protein NHQ30_007010 [Ciborinia camelliae]